MHDWRKRPCSVVLTIIFPMQTFEAAILTELYPRSQIDIYVEVLQADGGNLCACINAATLALIDAGLFIALRCHT